MQPINLIMKVTRNCNFRCIYCNEWRNTNDLMPFDVVARAIVSSIRDSDSPSVSFVWHGGEPLIRGVDFYRKVVALQFEAIEQVIQVNHRVEVFNGIQTNGRLLTPKWVDFLTNHEFSIGLSFDGPPEIHNYQRPDFSGNSTHETSLRAIKMLQEANAKFGILCVVTSKSLEIGAKKLMSYFLNLGIRNMSFLHLRPLNSRDKAYIPNIDYLSLDTYNQFLAEIFDYWFDLDDSTISIREFEGILDNLLGGRAQLCTLAGECYGRHFGINSNGDIYHCDRYVADKDYFLGNVYSTKFKDIINSVVLANLQKQNLERLKSCFSCKWFTACRGSCPHNNYIAQRSVHSLDNGKCKESFIFEHIAGKLANTLPKQTLSVKS